VTLAVLETRQAEERRRKAGQKKHWIREGHKAKAGLVKNLPDEGDVKNGTAGM
jgi:hypothetical protein